VNEIEEIKNFVAIDGHHNKVMCRMSDLWHKIIFSIGKTETPVFIHVSNCVKPYNMQNFLQCAQIFFTECTSSSS
jgi:hypothetical protein